MKDLYSERLVLIVLGGFSFGARSRGAVGAGAVAGVEAVAASHWRIP